MNSSSMQQIQQQLQTRLINQADKTPTPPARDDNGNNSSNDNDVCIVFQLL